jgi:ABC-type transport system involved in cytochrome bd biosynthesis fused ATPase/permease subunit
MNLNDPFNRLSRQRKSDYLSFKETLSQSGIHDIESLQALYDNTLRRTLLFVVILVVTGALIAFILPAFGTGIIIIDILIILWLFATTFRVRQFMRQYIQELRAQK